MPKVKDELIDPITTIASSVSGLAGGLDNIGEQQAIADAGRGDLAPYVVGNTWGDIFNADERTDEGLQIVRDNMKDYSSVQNMQNLENTWNPNDFQNEVQAGTSNGWDILSDAGTGAGIGASVGSLFGPLGTAIGTVGGTALGAISGFARSIFGDSANEERARELNKAIERANYQQLNNFYDRAGIIKNKQLRQNMMNYFSTGGDLDGLNGVEHFNVGGTHEENPNGGIPQGIASDGQPNLVEEGEIKYKDYIYSNRIKPSKSLLKNNYLPEKYAGLTYAEIADKLQEESEDRPNDPISLSTLEDWMTRLQAAQETQKAKIEERRVANMSDEEKVDLLSSLGQPMAQQEGIDLNQPMFAEGGKIHIKPENRGKFTATKKRTGKTTEELTHSKNPLTRKRAIFAQNAKKWAHKHDIGGHLAAYGMNLDIPPVLRFAANDNGEFKQNVIDLANYFSLDPSIVNDYYERNPVQAMIGESALGHLANIYRDSLSQDDYDALMALEYYNPNDNYYKGEPLSLDLGRRLVELAKAADDILLSSLGQSMAQQEEANIPILKQEPQFDANILSNTPTSVLEDLADKYTITALRDRTNVEPLNGGNSNLQFPYLNYALDNNKPFTLSNAPWWYELMDTNTPTEIGHVGNVNVNPNIGQEPQESANILSNTPSEIFEDLANKYPIVAYRDRTNVEPLAPIITPNIPSSIPIHDEYPIPNTYILESSNIPSSSPAPIPVHDNISAPTVDEYFDLAHPLRGRTINNNEWMRYMPAVGAGIGALVAGLQPEDFTYANQLRDIASQYRPVAAPHIGGYRRYNPYDVNLGDTENIALTAAALNANRGQNRATQGALNTAVINAAQKASAQRNLAAQQANEANRLSTDTYNLGIDKINLATTQAYDQLNQEINNRRASMLQAAAAAQDASSTARANILSTNLTNLFNQLGNVGRDQWGMNQLMAYINQHPELLNFVTT